MLVVLQQMQNSDNPRLKERCWLLCMQPNTSTSICMEKNSPSPTTSWDCEEPQTSNSQDWALASAPHAVLIQLDIPAWKNDLNPVDYLSRHPHHKPEKDNAAEAYISYVVQNTIPKSIIPEEAKKATEEDSLLQKVKAAVANGRWNDPQLSKFSPFKEELSRN